MKYIILIAAILCFLTPSVYATDYAGNEYTDIGDFANNLSSLSVEATINLTSLIANRHYAIVCRGNWSSGYSWCLYLSPIAGDTTHVRGRFQIQGVSDYYNAYDNDNTILNDGEDHVIKGTWDGNNIKLYIDSVDKTSLDGSAPGNYSVAQNVFIADVSDHNNDRSFIGSITNVKVMTGETVLYDNSATPSPSSTPIATEEISDVFTLSVMSWLKILLIPLLVFWIYLWITSLAKRV